MIALGRSPDRAIERDSGAGRLRRPRTLEGDRHARLQEATGVRDAQRDDAVFAELNFAEMRYGAARAHNRHMADFCAHDPRLMGVAVAPLDEPELALEELEFALKSGGKRSGCRITRAAANRPAMSSSILLGAAGRSEHPFVMHVGGSPLQLDKAWMNNGRPPVKDWMGGGENLRTKDIAVLHQGPETFLSMMLIDGVSSAFRTARRMCRAGRRMGAVDAGAAGLGGEDLEQDRCEPRAFTRNPSEQLTQQMAFTPFVFEEVGALID